MNNKSETTNIEKKESTGGKVIILSALLIFLFCGEVFLKLNPIHKLAPLLLFLALFPWISFFILRYFSIKGTGTGEETVQEKSTPNKWIKGILWGVALLLNASLAFIIYQAWLQGDDFMSSGFSIRGSIRWYLDWVPRIGDFLCRAFVVSENRWQVWLINPAYVTLLTLAVWCLLSRSIKSIYSVKGVCFFLFLYTLILLSVPLSNKEWYVFWLYTTSLNYLMPATTAAWLCYFCIRKSDIQQQTKYSVAALVWFLGLISGWGNEAVMIALGLVLMPLSIILYIKHKAFPLYFSYGLNGFIWGCGLMMLSPAHQARTVATLKTRALDLGSFNPEQLNNFLQNLDWEKVNLLRGTANTICFSDIPLMERLYFLPYLAERFWSVSCFPFICLLIMLVLVMCKRGNISKKEVILKTIALVGIASFTAFSFVYACIPTASSFFFPSLVVTFGCAYLFTLLPYKWVPQVCVSAGLLIYALTVFTPSAAEAFAYKRYEKQMWKSLHQQKAMGSKNIVLEFPYHGVTPKDELGLISRRPLKDDPNKYPNRGAAAYFGVDNIIMKQQPK